MVKCVEIVDVNEVSLLLIGNVDESHSWWKEEGGWGAEGNELT